MQAVAQDVAALPERNEQLPVLSVLHPFTYNGMLQQKFSGSLQDFGSMAGSIQVVGLDEVQEPDYVSSGC